MLYRTMLCPRGPAARAAFWNRRARETQLCVPLQLATRTDHSWARNSYNGFKMGEIEPFDPDSDSWSEWEERFVFLLESKQITDDAVKRARLLTACGRKAYSLFRTLVAPSKLSEKSFSEL